MRTLNFGCSQFLDETEVGRPDVDADTYVAENEHPEHVISAQCWQQYVQQAYGTWRKNLEKPVAKMDEAKSVESWTSAYMRQVTFLTKK